MSRHPQLPDWLLYLVVVAAMAAAALSRREPGQAPPPPPAASAILPEASPFDAREVVRASGALTAHSGTAFSIADRGVWLTARHVIEGCARPAIALGGGRAVQVRAVEEAQGETAVLESRGGAQGLPLYIGARLRRGMRAFHPGFPGDAPGEVTSRLIGREVLVLRGRRPAAQPVLVWAEVGRTSGQHASLAGLSGAPALDAEGRVVGVTIAQAPRRGRIYTTTPWSVVAAAAASGASSPGPGEAISLDNYGTVADDLRRNLRVAQVVCLTD